MSRKHDATVVGTGIGGLATGLFGAGIQTCLVSGLLAARYCGGHLESEAGPRATES